MRRHVGIPRKNRFVGPAGVACRSRSTAADRDHDIGFEQLPINQQRVTIDGGKVTQTVLVVGLMPNHQAPIGYQVIQLLAELPCLGKAASHHGNRLAPGTGPLERRHYAADHFSRVSHPIAQGDGDVVARHHGLRNGGESQGGLQRSGSGGRHVELACRGRRVVDTRPQPCFVTQGNRQRRLLA